MQRLAHALDAVMATRARREQVAHLAGLLRALPRAELALAARLALGVPVPPGDERALGVGFATLAAAIATVTGLSLGTVAVAARDTGDLGDAAQRLLPEHPGHLPLADVGLLLDALAQTPGRGQKQALLVQALRRAAPWEARWLVKALLGPPHAGPRRGVFEEALAAAFQAPLATVRRASALTLDPGALAVLAAEGHLDAAALEPGYPVALARASALADLGELGDPSGWVVEDRLDGVRAQVHVRDGRAWVYAAGHGEVAARLPEVATAVTRLPVPAVLDGALLSVHPDGRPRPARALERRLGLERPTPSTRAQEPVHFVAFDCLFDGEPLLDAPWHARRARLEALPLRVLPAQPVLQAISQPWLDARCAEACARGHAGLVLKHRDAPYEAGRRSSAWRALERAGGAGRDQLELFGGGGRAGPR